MDIDKLFTAMTNYAKCREQLVRMPASQKKEVQPNYDAAKTKLTAIINETIDERLTDHVKSGRVIDKKDKETETPPVTKTETSKPDEKVSHSGDDNETPISELF